MKIVILEKPMAVAEIKKLAEESYGFMIKGSVDIEKKQVALGGDYHIESCEALTGQGSAQQKVWGFNIRFEKDSETIIEFDSLINIKPALNNKSRLIEDEAVIKTATEIIESWIKR